MSLRAGGSGVPDHGGELEQWVAAATEPLELRYTVLALPWNTRSTLSHSPFPLLALALTRASRPRKKMNNRH